MNGNKNLLLWLRPLTKKLLRLVPLRLLSWLSTVPQLARLVTVELLARGWAWSPGHGLGRPVELLPGLPGGDAKARRTARACLRDMPGHPVSVYESTKILRGQGTDFTGKKVALLAHWDPQGQLDPYVVHYLRHLKELGWYTVLASASPPDLALHESPEVDALVHRSCKGYDFTSWKAALERMPSLLNARELVLTNDSIFAPVGSLAPVHAVMDAVACDFWGMVESHEVQPHLQSYYMVFRPKVLEHKAFKVFWDGVTASPRRVDAIRFELTLSLWLALHGLTPGAFVTVAARPLHVLNPAHDAWRELIGNGAPFIKRDLLQINRDCADLSDWAEVVGLRGYPVEFVANYLGRLGMKSKAPLPQTRYSDGSQGKPFRSLVQVEGLREMRR